MREFFTFLTTLSTTFEAGGPPFQTSDTWVSFSVRRILGGLPQARRAALRYSPRERIAGFRGWGLGAGLLFTQPSRLRFCGYSIPSAFGLCEGSELLDLAARSSQSSSRTKHKA
jgi:hypothetical protein